MGNKPMLHIMGSSPRPEYAEYEKESRKYWEEVHVPFHLSIKGLTGVTSYQLIERPENPTGVSYPKYLGVYTFDSKESYEKYYRDGPEHVAAMKDSRERWKIPVSEMKWGVDYEFMRSWELAGTASKMEKGNRPMIHIIGVQPHPEDDEKFNKWYDEIHIPFHLPIKGLTGITRYQLVVGFVGDPAAYPGYLTIYAFDSKENYDKYYMTGPEHTVAMEEMRETWKERRYEVRWAVQYEFTRHLEPRGIGC